MTSKTFERKLSAILSADVAGYSRLMGSDEDLTITTLTGHREMMSTLIENHNGRVIDSPGDNLLAAFSSVTQAVDCAVEIQREMAERNEELPDDRIMEYRIGVNLGDVIEEGNRIYGDGVNIAARLEALAEPGGICISGFVYNQVKNRLKLEYEYLGEQSVKNIKEPVPVYRVLSFPGAAAHRVIEAKKAAEMEKDASFFRDKPSIAVLPFVDLSREKDQEYFVDGLSEEILNSLTQISDLLVTGRTSSFTFKGSNKKTPEIASELGVENILEGSVRKAGNDLRITAQLLRGTDGFHLWSKIYKRELKDIFDVQEDIATAVADELKLTLGVGKSIKHVGTTDDVEAYKYYLIAKGQYNSVETKSALESLDEALAIDPNFALAWASKAIIHTFLILYGLADKSVTEKDAALKAAQTAIELEPNMAAGYYSLGYIKMTVGEFMAAGLAYRKALELTDEPLSFIVPVIAILYLAVGNFQKANVFLKEMLQKDPLNQAYYGFYIYSFGFLGDLKQAKQEIERADILFGDQWDGRFFPDLSLIGTSEALSPNDIVYANPIFNALKEHLDSPREGIAELRRIYNDAANINVLNLIFISIWAAYFGNPEFAMDAMEKVLSSDAGSIFNAWHPVMREVRQLPRFKEFVREIGLVDYWKKFGWPDFCRPLENGDLEFD